MGGNRGEGEGNRGEGGGNRGEECEEILSYEEKR